MYLNTKDIWNRSRALGNISGNETYNFTQNYWAHLKITPSPASMMLSRHWLWTLTPDPQYWLWVHGGGF